ncbi:MAG TPA: rhomboid family intramembrane serine protease [Mucilaginibacter sp.]|nr:rhomboid family intramembrane serine protease [Mucilaginibacter sp.]
MAFGFTPKFEQSLYLNGLNPEHYLAIAIDAAKQLGWNTTNINKSGFTAYTGFSMRSWNEEFSVNIDDETVNLQSKCLGNQLIDWGKNKDNVESFIEEFNKIQSAWTDEHINEKLNSKAIDIQPLNANGTDQTPAASLGKVQGFFSLFTPREGYYVTPIIIDINILIFILMAVSGVSLFEPNTNDLLKWGADFRPVTLDGQWWRLLTSIFLHIGIFHILFNMYALLYIGLLLEPYLGKLRFVTAYLFTGLISSLTSIYWHPFTISAGASGAIFGMYGIFLAMLTTNIIDKKTRSALFASIGVFVVFNLINGAKAGIDSAAHIGGLISGLIIGYGYYPSLKNPGSLNLKYVTVTILLVATLTTSFVIYYHIPHDDIGVYETKMKDFAAKERIALDVFNGRNRSNTQLLSDIKDKGLTNWNEALKISNGVDNLNIPQQLKDRNNIIRQYCLLQITKYRLLYNAVKENTLQYDKSIDSCNKSIADIIKSLSSPR